MEKDGTSSAVSQDVIEFIAAFPSLTIADDTFSKTSKVKCSLTGHEMTCRVAEVETYTKGKRFKKAQERDKDNYEQFKPHVVPSNKKGREHQLFCTLTLRHINRTPVHVERHVTGRKYKRALKKYEECQRLGIKFKPLAKSKKREASGEGEAKKFSHSATSDTSESEESDDSMSDLYPREHFERVEAEDQVEAESDGSGSDSDVENMDCKPQEVNGTSSQADLNKRAKRKNPFKKGGRRKVSNVQQGQDASNQKRATKRKVSNVQQGQEASNEKRAAKKKGSKQSRSEMT